MMFKANINQYANQNLAGGIHSSTEKEYFKALQKHLSTNDWPN